MTTRYEHTFSITSLIGEGTMHLWTGNADLTLGGVTYKPSNWLAGAEPVEIAGLDDTETRMELKLHVPTLEARKLFLMDPGAVKVRIGGVYSTDGGLTWSAVDRGFSGRLSGGVLRDATYDVDLVSRAGDPFRRYVRTWSDREQQERYPGDTGLSRLAELEHGVEIRWPYEAVEDEETDTVGELVVSVAAITGSSVTLVAAGAAADARIHWDVKKTSGSNQGSVNNSLGASGAASLTLSNLVAGDTYTARVRACQAWISAASDTYCSGFSPVITFVPYVDVTPPVLLSASVALRVLTLVFNEDLDTSGVPGAAAFTVTGVSAGNSLSSVEIIGGSVRLTLQNKARIADTNVTVAYTKPSTNPLKDTSGNEVATFAAMSVVNNTGVELPPPSD